MKKLFLLFIVTGLVSCSQSKREVRGVQEGEVLYSIKIDKPDFSSLKPLRLSEFVDSVSYVQLETTSDCLLPYSGTRNMYRTGDFLFLSQLFSIYQFDAISGKFLRQIGKKGQGPGEYLQVNDAVDRESQILYVKSPGNPKLLRYDYEGKYLGDLRFSDTDEFSFSTCFYSLKLIEVNTQYMVFLSDIMASEQACHPYEIIVYDYKNGKIRHSLENRMGGTFNRSIFLVNGMRAITQQDDHFFYKSFYNDTLYSIHLEKGIKPYVIIDLGKRKYPVEALFEKNKYMETDGKIIINSIFVSGNSILLGGYMIDAESSQSFICKYSVLTDELTYHSPLLLNDLDGGANVDVSDLSRRIVPVMPFDAVEEKGKEIFFSTLNQSKLKYPELKEKFDRMQKTRNSDDNPLLMMLYMKK